MELRQLEYFVAVVEEASFTRAAARVHVAQPGVSAQIRRLEAELGEPLLDRGSRAGVRVTAVGAAVLPFARAALAAVDGLRAAVDELQGVTRGRVGVGMVVGCPSLDVPALVAGFHARYPGVEIALVEDTTDVLVAGLIDGSLDLALVALASGAGEGLAQRVIVAEPFVATVVGGSPLAGLPSVALAALCADYELISLPAGTGARAALEECCRAIGVTPRVAFEASAPAMLLRLAEQGLGVAILPASTPTALAKVPIVDPSPAGAIALAWRADGPRSPAARALIEHAEGFLGAASSGSQADTATLVGRSTRARSSAG